MEKSSSHRWWWYPKDQAQGCTKGQKSGGAGSNAARRRCPAAPSDLPKSGGAAAPPAPPLGASMHRGHLNVSELGSSRLFISGMQQAGGPGGPRPPQILADQKAPPGSGGAPHYYRPPRIFDPWCIPEDKSFQEKLVKYAKCCWFIIKIIGHFSEKTRNFQAVFRYWYTTTDYPKAHTVSLDWFQRFPTFATI